MKRRLAVLALAGIAAAGQHATPDAAEMAAVKQSDEARSAGHYLAATRALEPVAFDHDKPVAGFAFQMWQQFGAMLTERPSPLSPYSPKPLDNADAATLRGVDLADALPEIVRRAHDTRIVFQNEEHDNPRDRAFGLEVARALRPLGYRTLALETLSNDARPTALANKMARLQGEGYVHRTTGTYTQDPAFADFVRQALALGYRPVAYEQTDGKPGIAAREQAEADNLIRSALPKGGNDKLLVYVGYSHAAEAPIRGDRWLAARVEAATGIDPLTIDQAWLGIDPARKLLAPRAGDRTAVLMKDGKPFVWGQFAGAIDLQVIHPAVADIAGRPGWLVGMGRRPSPIPPALLPQHGIRLVQAFLANEAADAIPVDQVLVVAGRPAPALMLPPGRPVRYAVEDDPGDPPIHAARQ